MIPRLYIRDIALFERPMRFSHPFRFGAVSVAEAPQAFVRVEIEVEGRGRAVGASAEMMMPKWFDKRPQLSPEATIDALRRALLVARDLYLSDRRDSAFGLHAAVIADQVAACAALDIPPLAAGFGPAEIDKAIVDALLRALGIDFFTAMARNVAGIDARLTPDLEDGAIAAFLAGRQRSPHVAVRHTVGLADPLEGPGGLAAIAAADGLRYFKLKLAGDAEADAARLAAIGRVLDEIGDSRVTLDANEQYADLAALRVLLGRLRCDGELAPIARRLLYIEQPLPRDLTRQIPLGDWAGPAVIIDEADDGYDAFPAARALGYRGVSSKSCKGLYKSVLNVARAAGWSRQGEACFVSAEDLTCQPGLGLQQDLALVALLGLTHAERNGHHYVAGFGDAPAGEQGAFQSAHPDLYARTEDGIRLAIRNGALPSASLAVSGFASAAHPDWASLSPLRIRQEQQLQES